MKKVFLFLFCLIVIISSTAFANSKAGYNPELSKAIIEATKPNNSDNKYVVFHEDLNDDNTEEILVYAWGSDFSCEKGDSLLIFNFDGTNYNLISILRGINMPILISNHKTNTFNDIFVVVRGSEDKEILFRPIIYKDNTYKINTNINDEKHLKDISIKKVINVRLK